MITTPETLTVLESVDPDLRASLEAFPGFDITAEFLPIIRQFPAKPPRQTPSYREVFIAPVDEERPLRCLIVDPIPDAQNRPVLVYYHGGGFIFGSPEITLPTAQKLAEDVGCLIVLLEYRLAPEHPYPAALEDGLRVLSWLDANADRLRLDTSRIAIGGDSAGGGHAVVLTEAAYERSPINPSNLFLVYPMLDNETGADGTGGTRIWTAKNNRFGWASYMGSAAAVDVTVPATIKTLQNFPPTFLATGTLDLFFDENIRFVEDLQSKGVSVEHHVFEGAYHAFDVMVPEAKISKNFHVACVNGLKKHLIA